MISLNKKITKILKIFCINLLFFLSFLSSAFSNEKQENATLQMKYDEKNYAGPMGMGLVKSFKIKDNIFCFYNTIKGYKKLILQNKSDCPSELPE